MLWDRVQSRVSAAATTQGSVTERRRLHRTDTVESKTEIVLRVRALPNSLAGTHRVLRGSNLSYNNLCSVWRAIVEHFLSTARFNQLKILGRTSGNRC
jgi:hypothetical protein